MEEEKKTRKRTSRSNHKPIEIEKHNKGGAQTAALPVRTPQPLLHKEPVIRAHASSSVRRWVLWGVLLVVILLFCGTTVFSIGLYRFGWSGAWVDPVVRSVPFPAVVADTQFIRMSDYRDDLKTLLHYFSTQAATEGAERPSDGEIKATVLNRLIYDTVVDELVTKYSVTIAADELEQQLSSIAESRGSRDDINALLQSLYGWNEQQFKEKVLRPYIALEKLNTILSNDGTLTGDAKTRAEEALKKLNAKEQTFEQLANSVSDDTNASVGGDLGFFGASDMDAAIIDALDALQPEETSGIVQSEYGYHILQLIEKMDDAEKGTQYHARHIFFEAKNIDEYINDEIAERKIRVLISGLAWDKENHWIVPVESAS